MGYRKSSSKKEVYSNTVLHKEIRKISNKQLNLTSKATREKRTKKQPKVRRIEFIKIKADINEI